MSPGEVDGARLGARLAARDLTAAAGVLNLVESRTPEAGAQAAALLAAVSPASLGGEAPAHVVGITGPPGVGKSSLLSRLVAQWRGSERSVAVLAVDPTSRRSGGALLGDRARLEVDPTDRELFIRSTAAGDRLGGLAPATRAAASALAAAFDVVVIETVGVGQSETEVADVADTVAVVIQPGSGDVMQFLKAGIMEVPDVLVVTKSDLGRIADRTVADLRAALRSLGAAEVEVVPASSVAPSGIAEVVGALDRHRAALDLPARRLRSRRMHALADFAGEFGERGLRALGGRRRAERWLAEQEPGLDVPALERLLARRADEGRVTGNNRAVNRIVLPAEPLVDGPTALRPWRDSDLAQLVSICQDPEIPRWTRVPERFGEADGRAYLLSRYDAILSGVTVPFAIVDADDDTRVLGSTSLFALNWDHLRGEVGYWLGRGARGRGTSPGPLD